MAAQHYPGGRLTEDQQQSKETIGRKKKQGGSRCNSVQDSGSQHYWAESLDLVCLCRLPLVLDTTMQTSVIIHRMCKNNNDWVFSATLEETQLKSPKRLIRFRK